MVTPENQAGATDSGQSVADRDWFECAVIELLSDLFGTALRLTRNRVDAEDLVADTVARAWSHRHELADRGRLRGWLFRILTRVAVFTPPDARHWIIVNDQAHDVVGYNFSSNATLTENFRLHDEKHKLTSTPMVLPDGHTLVGTAEESNAGGIVFTRPNGIKLPTVAGLGAIYAAPTGSAKGHVVVIGSKGLALLEDAKVLSRTALPSESYVSAAASRTHVFV